MLLRRAFGALRLRQVRRRLDLVDAVRVDFFCAVPLYQNGGVRPVARDVRDSPAIFFKFCSRLFGPDLR